MQKIQTPIDAIRHYYRGRVYEATNEFENAIEEYRKAISSGCGYADVHNSLGRVLMKCGYYEEARIEFEYALRLNPRYLDARRNLDELLAKISMIIPTKNFVKQNSEQEDKKQYVKDTNVSQTIVTQSVNDSLLAQQKTDSQLICVSNKNIVLYIIAGIVFLIGLFFMVTKTTLFEKNEEQKVFEIENYSISSITEHENQLILSDWATQEIIFYKINKNQLEKINSEKLSQDNVVPTSIVVSDKKLWVLDGWNKKVYKYSMSKSNLSLIKMFDVKTSVPTAIVGYKKNILIVDSGEQKIILYDQNFNEIVAIPFVVKNMSLMSSKENQIWVYDKNNFLHQLKDYSEIKNSYKVDVLTDKTLSSFFINKKYLWLTEEGEAKLFRYTKRILK